MNKKLRGRCDAAALWLARQRREDDCSTSHLQETPQAPQRAKLLRCSQLANVQAVDEDDMNDRRRACKHEPADLRRDGSAASSGDSMADINRRIDDVEALLSYPHAFPRFLSETQMPGIQTSALALERPIAIALRAIAAHDCIHILVLQPRKRRELKNPSMRSPRGQSYLRRSHCRTGEPGFPRGKCKITCEFRVN